MDGLVLAALGPLGQPREAWPLREAAEGQAALAEQRPGLAPPGPLAETKPAEEAASSPLPQTYLRFIVDEWGRVHVKVVDASSNEVIREIPPEEVARVTAAIRAYQQKHLPRWSIQG